MLALVLHLSLSPSCCATHAGIMDVLDIAAAHIIGHDWGALLVSIICDYEHAAMD